MRVADLFAGCGGMSAGFQSADYEVVMAAEKWDAARDVYNANFDHDASAIDLSNLVEATYRVNRENPDIIVGGPPCQDFSAAGQRRETDRADLTMVFAEIVRAVRPQWFVMENVGAVVGSAAYSHARPTLSSAGYGLTEVVLDASFFGVPQIRKRFFCIGCLGEEDGFLKRQLEDVRRENRMSVRDYLGDEFGIDVYYRHPRNWGRKAIYSIDEPSATVRSTNRPISPKYRLHENDASDTLEGVRQLTPQERARIQTFAREFAFSGTRTDIDTMVANAVPLALAQRVGESIAIYERSRGLADSDDDFRRWLSEERGMTPASIGDVLSRLRRVDKLLAGRECGSDPRDTIHELSKLPEFEHLTTSVRSHLKRAVQLQAEFRARH
ncbi:DNA (cytosine-5-)-methyltransferase [Sphingomonas sp. BT-65]|uniref:DNA cytosine methyltransferase n=1 Tax=Sphingomonas sp. BT-65 TaxID=2989821 RepID=UPI002235B6D6|nr:DNA (cytosine-5-)-methyltransferase [Sphingomonas sp. BT-65]MCW4460822.1 DNA (cytosine-5-)-methyltransferase [Sphingomonas sp. BT-65]